jgi:hypothetical protein
MTPVLGSKASTNSSTLPTLKVSVLRPYALVTRECRRSLLLTPAIRPGLSQIADASLALNNSKLTAAFHPWKPS